MSEVPVIDEQKLQNFGTRLFDLFKQHVTDRKSAEERWMKNLLAYRGIYSDEVLAMIGKDKSKAYPKMMRWKIIGTCARLMQMLWPQTEKNYGIKPSPLPDLQIAQLQEVLDTLVNLTSQRDQIDPKDVVLKDEDIEKAIYEYAAHKAEQMEKKIDDDLTECEFITIARQVVFSACLYNVGIAKGPLHRKVKARKWTRNPNNGKYTAIEVDSFKPLYEFLRCWDWYPDMTAKTIKGQDGEFERHIMNRQHIEELAERPDFMADRINTWLKNHPAGNYVPQWWETIMKGMPKSDQTLVANKEGRKYEVHAYVGNVSGHELRAAGVEITDDQLGRSFHANVWALDNWVIKAKLQPLQEHRQHHTFVFEDDDLSLLGNGQGDTLYDSQMAICETARAALDNMSVIGPNIIVNDDVLTPGQSTAVEKHKTWHVEGLSGNQSIDSAVKNLNIESHLPELQNLLQMFMEFANQESGLPPPSVGDTSGGGSEALRTSKNASMFLGAAALPLRDTVRNYDTFTISVINALVAWNRKYDPNPVRDGDMDVIGRGSTSLIAKEVLAGNLAEFKASITPDEMPHVDTRKLLEARARANDIPADQLLLDKDVADANIAKQAEAAQKQTELQEALIQAQVEDLFAGMIKKIADAKSADASIENNAADIAIKFMNSMLDAVKGGHENAIKEKAANKPVVKAGAK